MAVVEPEGGFLHVEQCVIAHVTSTHRHGAEIRARERVLDWESTAEGGVQVETNRDSYTADTMVVTAEAWAAKLLLMLEVRIVPERQVLSWFRPEMPERFQSESFPVFTKSCEEGYFYGFPKYRAPGYKVDKYNHFHERVNSDEVAELTRSDERVLREFTERYFPEAAGPTMRFETCLFTNSLDEHFVLDTLPDHPQVVIGGGSRAMDSNCRASSARFWQNWPSRARADTTSTCSRSTDSNHENRATLNRSNSANSSVDSPSIESATSFPL